MSLQDFFMDLLIVGAGSWFGNGTPNGVGSNQLLFNFLKDLS
ncbi:hypothetical protein ABEU20_001543 [Rhodococcus sp. PAM 2766]|uniref:Uncharacterized protein n=1 Tax=Rhodococcus parequi TaxID=3137122 RepID=A0ABW9FBS9_9NOCA